VPHPFRSLIAKWVGSDTASHKDPLLPLLFFLSFPSGNLLVESI
jgi:hypothetical protein